MLRKRWTGLLQGPGPAWQEVHLNTDEDFPISHTFGRFNGRDVMALFGRRAVSVRKLHWRDRFLRLPTSVLAAVLMTQAASLCDLSFYSRKALEEGRRH